MIQLKTKTNQNKPRVYIQQLLIVTLSILYLQVNSQNFCSAKYTYYSTNGVDYQFYNANDSLDSLTYSYLWTFGDGQTSTLKNPTHSFSSSGGYNTCLKIVSQDSSCFDTFCDSIYVFKKCRASFVAFRDSKNPNLVYVTNNSVEKSYRYLWDFGDGQTSSAANPKPHEYANPYSHLITLTICDTINPCSDTMQAATASICSADFTYMFNAYNNLSFKPKNDSVYYDSYFWDFGDGGTSKNSQPNHIYNSDGNYLVCLTISDKNNAWAVTYCDTVIIKSCKASFKIKKTGPLSIVVDDLSISAQFGNTLDFGDGYTSTNIKSRSHKYSAGGLYNICMTLNNDQGCEDTYCEKIYLDSTYIDTVHIDTCNASFSYTNPSGNTYNFQPSKPGASYYWDFGDGSYSFNETVVHTFPDNKSYDVCLEVTSDYDTLCKDVKCVTIVGISETCKSAFTINHDSLSNEFIIVNESTGSNITYFWSFGDSTYSTLPYPTHTYPGSGPYELCLTVKNASCTNTFCNSVSLDSLKFARGEYFLSIRVIGKTTGEQKNELAKTFMQAYPNPFNSHATIDYTLSVNSPIELAVYDLLGNRVSLLETGSKTAGVHHADWDASPLPGGIYLLQLRTSGELVTKKLILQK